MKKPYDYKEVNPTRRCVDCNRPLKKNLLAKLPEAKRCWACNKLHSNNQNIDRIELRKKQKKARISYQG